MMAESISALRMRKIHLKAYADWSVRVVDGNSDDSRRTATQNYKREALLPELDQWYDATLRATGS